MEGSEIMGGEVNITTCIQFEDKPKRRVPGEKKIYSTVVTSGTKHGASNASKAT